MLELIGLLGGAVVRLFPSLMDFFKQGRDMKYELLRMEKEVELEKQRGANKEIEIAAASAAAVDASWADGLVEALKGQAQVTGDRWLDRLNVSVRPVITYWWCIVLYTVNKLVLVAVGVQQKVELAQFSTVLYTPFDQAVVGSIIGFWFVDRALRGGKFK